MNNLIKSLYFLFYRVSLLEKYEDYINYEFSLDKLNELTKNNLLLESILTNKFISIYDKNYPQSLRTSQFPPPIIFYKGNVELLFSTKSIAIVGSRRSSLYGENVCKYLLSNLNEYTFTSISGLALGIDTFTHEFSLEHNIPTIAVLGSGINNIYPKTNSILADRILENNGLIISEFLPDTPPLKHHFPQRNRIIAALSNAVIVVEAQNDSGTLHTASWALQFNKDVFAIPGSILSQNSEGTNKLIFDGAIPLINYMILCEKLGLVKKHLNECKKTISFSESEKLIIDALQNGPLSLNTLLILINKNSQDISKALIDLTIKRAITKHFGNYYSLNLFK